MAKGKGWALAKLRMLVNNSESWYRAVLASAGLNPNECPVCGYTSEYGYNDSVLCCRCFAWPEPTDRTKIVLSVAKEAEAEIRDPDNPEDIVVVVDENDNEVAWYARGRKHPVWNFVDKYDNVPEDDPGTLLEGLKVIYPEWWPHEELAQFDEQDAKQVEVELAEVESLLNELSSSWLDSEWIQNASSLAQKLSRMKEKLESLREIRKVNEIAVKKREAEQEIFDKALRENGFFYGRTGKASIPASILQFSRSSNGSRSDPVRMLVNSKLTFEQLEAFVLSVGDFSRASKTDNGQIQITTEYMGKWIGKDGSVVKFLSSAVGSRIQIVEKS